MELVARLVFLIELKRFLQTFRAVEAAFEDLGLLSVKSIKTDPCLVKVLDCHFKLNHVFSVKCQFVEVFAFLVGPCSDYSALVVGYCAVEVDRVITIDPLKFNFFVLDRSF